MFSQSLETSPVHITIEYKDGKKTIKNIIYYKKNNPDSFHNSLNHDFKDEFLIKSDSAYICSNIIGKWKFNSAVRTNNKKINLSQPIYYIFNADKSFYSINSKDTTYGNWSYSNNAKGVIEIYYQIPKIIEIPEELKKELDPTFLKELENTNNEILTLNNLTNQTLTFFITFPTESKKIGDELYMRIIKIIYNKVQ